MGLWWLVTVAACVTYASADRGGSSLRGALEALQRRQRGRVHGPIIPQADYDAVYEFIPPQNYAPDYPVDIENLDDDQAAKYYVKLLDDDLRPAEDAYEYKLIKKKNAANLATKKESAFRERSHHSDNERLRDLFMDKNEAEEKKLLEGIPDNDAEYALLLGQLWSKYKSNKEHANNVETAPQGVVKLYKEKIVKKRYSDNWGPIAFKRKRSSDSDTEHPVIFDYDARKAAAATANPNYNKYDLTDDDKDDIREEYAIAFQPLDDDSWSEIADDDQYPYDALEKRFPVSKRSSGPYNLNSQKKRFAAMQNKRETSKSFRSSAGTDPKIIKDLSKIFGDTEVDVIKFPVKRSSDHEEHEHNHGPDHEVKPPMITTVHNNTHEHNKSADADDDSHEHHGHNIHHPGITGKEVQHEHVNGRDHHDHGRYVNERPINIKKKSIDWSDYFGIDKRSKNAVTFVNDETQDKLRKQYFDTFNKEVIYPLNSFRRHTNVKRNFVQAKPNEETEIQVDNAHFLLEKNNKRALTNVDSSKLDNIDKRLRDMEGIIVDEAMHYYTGEEQLDTKEEQEMKEKLLSRLATAYSLEKMRKALKDFKQNLQTQKSNSGAESSVTPTDEAKVKRVAVKKEKVNIISNDIPKFENGDDNDFEDEQGAGHYLNGKTEGQLSEGYMGGSGRHRVPVMSTAGASGSCPVLSKIVQRCHGVDLLAGDRGQLFLPLCSLHQICYLCGEVIPTTCDLVYLSEADTICEGDMSCQRAARSALMALRELHDSLADELDGECEASPCLPATLKLNLSWQRAFQQ